MSGPTDHALYLLFTPSLCVRDPWRILEDALRGGVDLVQWRAKSDDPDGARRCLDLCADHGVPMIVNDDVELAVKIAAAGAHVGQGDMDPSRARQLLGPERWLGVSTHDGDEIRRAREGGADHLGFGPMFPTSTKGYVEGQPEGALGVALERAAPLPVFAIGGIGVENVRSVVADGCRRIAVSRAILTADDPAAVAAALRRALAD